MDVGLHNQKLVKCADDYCRFIVANVRTNVSTAAKRLLRPAFSGRTYDNIPAKNRLKYVDNWFLDYWTIYNTIQYKNLHVAQRPSSWHAEAEARAVTGGTRQQQNNVSF